MYTCTHTHVHAHPPTPYHIGIHTYLLVIWGTYLSFKTAVVNNSKQVFIIHIAEKVVIFLMCKEQANETNVKYSDKKK